VAIPGDDRLRLRLKIKAGGGKKGTSSSVSQSLTLLCQLGFITKVRKGRYRLNLEPRSSAMTEQGSSAITEQNYNKNYRAPSPVLLDEKTATSSEGEELQEIFRDDGRSPTDEDWTSAFADVGADVA
jgi:hypothetical protein